MSFNVKSFVRDPVLRAVLELFQPRFVPEAHLVWLIEEETPVAPLVDDLANSGMYPISTCELPNVVFYERQSDRFVFVDVATIRGQMTSSRCAIIKRLFVERDSQIIPVNAFADRRAFRGDADLPWSSAAWFADEPDHLIQFDGPFLTIGSRDEFSV
jgi:hypothetical protein